MIIKRFEILLETCVNFTDVIECQNASDMLIFFFWQRIFLWTTIKTKRTDIQVLCNRLKVLISWHLGGTKSNKAKWHKYVTTGINLLIRQRGSKAYDKASIILCLLIDACHSSYYRRPISYVSDDFASFKLLRCLGLSEQLFTPIVMRLPL